MQQQHTLSTDLTTVLRGINFQSHITTRHVSGKAQAQITGVFLVTEPALDRCKGIHVQLSSSLRELRNQPHTMRSLISGKERTEVLKQREDRWVGVVPASCLYWFALYYQSLAQKCMDFFLLAISFKIISYHKSYDYRLAHVVCRCNFSV